jgi:hypothetical protein
VDEPVKTDEMTLEIAPRILEARSPRIYVVSLPVMRRFRVVYPEDYGSGSWPARP